MKTLEKSKLQVWWIPQVPMKAFEVEVKTVEEAVKIMNTLAEYDMFQYENKVKPDYTNTGGLNIWDDVEGEYNSWYIEINQNIKGEKVFEYFENPREYLRFLEENGLKEEDIE